MPSFELTRGEVVSSAVVMMLVGIAAAPKLDYRPPRVEFVVLESILWEGGTVPRDTYIAPRRRRFVKTCTSWSFAQHEVLACAPRFGVLFSRFGQSQL